MYHQNREPSGVTPEPFIPQLSHQASDQTIRPDAHAPESQPTTGPACVAHPEALAQDDLSWGPAHDVQGHLKNEDNSDSVFTIDNEGLFKYSLAGSFLDFGAQDDFLSHQPLVDVTAPSSVVPDPPPDLPNGALTARRAIRRSSGFAGPSKLMPHDPRHRHPPPSRDGAQCRKQSLPIKFEHQPPPDNRLLEANLATTQAWQPLDFDVPTVCETSTAGTSDFLMFPDDPYASPVFSLTLEGSSPRLSPSEPPGTDSNISFSHVGGWLAIPEVDTSAGTSPTSPLSVSPLSAPRSRASTILSGVSTRDSDTSYRSTRKRSKRGSDDEDDDPDRDDYDDADEDAMDSRKSARKSGGARRSTNSKSNNNNSGSGGGNGRYFACPYYKHDPIKHGSCLKFELRRIKDVKQHIYRKHRRPEFYCPVCSLVFPDRSALDGHVRQYSAAIHERRPAPEGISSKQHKALQQRGNRKDSAERQWMDIWSVVFGDQKKPESVYLESYVEESIATLRGVLAKRGDDVIASALSSTLEQDIHASMGSEKGSEVVELVRSSLDRILEGLLQEAKAAMSSSSSSGPSAAPSSDSLRVPHSHCTGSSASSSASSYHLARTPDPGEPSPAGGGGDPLFSDTSHSANLRMASVDLVPAKAEDHEMWYGDLSKLYDDPSFDICIFDAPPAEPCVQSRHTI